MHFDKKAKLAALKGAHKEISDMMKEGLNGSKKVVVKADSKEGLEKGLDMAKKIVDKGPESVLGQQEDEDLVESDTEADDMVAKMKSHEAKQEASEPMDEAEIDEEIQRLIALKEKLASQE